jgi:Flp pilus assembly protein TadG
MTTTKKSRFYRIARDQQGIAAMEFGLLILPLTTLIMGALDVGYMVYVQSVLDGTLSDVARRASTESPNFAAINSNPDAPPETIEQRIRNEVRTKISKIAPSANLQSNVQVRSFFDFGSVGNPERLTTDANGNGEYDDGDCWADVDGDQRYDLVSTGANSLGNASDVVLYQATIRVPRLFPMAGLIGLSEEYRLQSKTMFRRQPFETRINNAVTRCNQIVTVEDPNEPIDDGFGIE